jgi:exosortase C (VPDSG-CTERM-specific)
LYSYILLIPFISGYLVWHGRKSLSKVSAPAKKSASFLAAGGAVTLLAYWWVDRQGMGLKPDDRLAFTTFAFLLLFWSACRFFLGAQTTSKLGFAFGLLIFLVPVPARAMAAIDTFLQHGSAFVADAMFSLSGTTFSRVGLVFQLPGIFIRVAPECSGIHSSMVLLITSLLAGHFFLRSPRKRALLTLAVLPLALLRNGFRIYTLGQLCVHIGPEMIDSPIHHKGGPIFFGLSLVPFLLLLYYLQKSERAKTEPVITSDLPGHAESSASGSRS